MNRKTPWRHYGVYAFIQDSGQVLVVGKTRGPYDGWLDLPGGGMETGETAKLALQRELHEELGARIEKQESWRSFSLVVTSDSQGQPIQFTHEGLIAPVILQQPGRVAQPKQDEDVSQALWVPKNRLLRQGGVSAPLRHALAMVS